MIALQAEPFDAAALLADLSARAAGAGAIASFSGLVRGENDGATVSGLELDHHPRLTDSRSPASARMRARASSSTDLAIVHRHGAIAPGETIVFVAAAAAHRRAAFDAADYLMDRLKTDALLEARGRAATARTGSSRATRTMRDRGAMGDVPGR